MKDFYNILGVDSNASADSIKAAYRRLAREVHPDRVWNLNSGQQGEQFTNMTELNEAYETLSNPARRRGYDLVFRPPGNGSTVTAVAEPPVPVSRQRSEQRYGSPVARPRNGSDVASCVLQEYSRHLRRVLLTWNDQADWRPMALEGFEWAMDSSSWFVHSVVAFRGFVTFNPEASRKALNYVAFAMRKSRQVLKQNNFLFLFAFQRTSDLEEALPPVQAFSAQHGKHASILLLDAYRQLPLPSSPAITNHRIAKVVGSLGAPQFSHF